MPSLGWHGNSLHCGDIGPARACVMVGLKGEAGLQPAQPPDRNLLAPAATSCPTSHLLTFEEES